VPWLQPYPDGWLAGIVDTNRAPDQSLQATETIEIAFVAALQRIPPRQAAVLVLRDVVGFTPREVADLLDTTETAIKGLLQRARASVKGSDAVSREPPARRGAASARGERELGRRFATAYLNGDVAGVVALLTDDAWLSMPPAPHRYQGHHAIATFFRASFEWRANLHLCLVPTRANRQVAYASYLADHANAIHGPAGLLVVSAGPDGIRAIHRFHHPGLYAAFGLSDAPQHA
jgi:RNA polymerase sigma-70 factor (ECF subfamily)